MMKYYYRRALTSALPLWLGGLMVGAVCLPVGLEANTPGPVRTLAPAPASTVAAAPVMASPMVESFPQLDSRRLYALGMIETGNNDRVIGSAGEVSRYQLMPVVWKSYSKSMDYRNPDMALQVARAHWSYLAAYFKEKTGRAPQDYDMYVLWNTRHGYFARHGFSRRALGMVVQERAERFVNLVNRKG